MVRVCKYCKQKAANNTSPNGRTLHQFPWNDDNLADIWKRQLKFHPSFVATKYTLICSDHFRSKCFRLVHTRRILIPGSIPTIFKDRKVSCFYCDATKESNPGISLRKFPLRNPVMLKKWLDEINIKDFVPDEQTLICSDHFTKSSFRKIHNRKNLNLKENAYPSIFSKRKSANLTDCFNKDWVPTLHLGYSKRTNERERSYSSSSEGKCAKLTDYLNPDWVPTINLVLVKQPRANAKSQTKGLQNKKLEACQVNNSTSSIKKKDEDPIETGKSLNEEVFGGEYFNATIQDTNHQQPIIVDDDVMESEKSSIEEYEEESFDETKQDSEDLIKIDEFDQDSEDQKTNTEDDHVMESEKSLNEDFDEESDEEYFDETNQDTADETNQDSAAYTQIKEEQSTTTSLDTGAINCCVPNCKNVRSKLKSRVKFFRFPNGTQIINGKIYRSERLAKWINAIKRIDITHLNAHCKIICSEHFETGAPANAIEKSHVDWIPNRKLPTTLNKAVRKNKSPTSKVKKFEPWNSFDEFDPLAEEEIQMQAEIPEVKIVTNIELENMQKEIQQLKLENETLKKQLIKKDLEIAEKHTELLKLIEKHKLELSEQKSTIQMMETENLKISLSKDGFKNDDKKVNYFTGLPSFAVLEIIFNFVEKDLVGSMMRRINKFDAFILVLLKLRLDLPLTYLGYRYGIAGNTAATIYHRNLKMLGDKIAPFIRWPDKTEEVKTTCVFFKRVLGNKFAAMFDFIDDPGLQVSQEYIIQRKYVKKKYLVAISPAGAIAFISKSYDSSLSIKEIAESCGVLDYTEDGDIILSDHGLVTHQVFSYNGTKVLIQSTKQENDLIDSLLQNSTESNENAPSEDNNGRIYIQRTISNLMNKFFILSNKQKVLVTKSYKESEGERYFDYVVKVCCALSNVSPTMVNFETKKVKCIKSK